MSGICGVTSKMISTDERIRLVYRMVFCMNHRGPDNSESWSNEFISLGHNRLSIIDLSSNANQPMHKGEWVITYDGVIYNYMEIRSELEYKHNLQFITNSDAEVILAAWDTWGEKAINKFRGMWAFSIYNKTSHDLYLCRDRFGIKPLYYYELNGHFLFASEIKAILEDKNVARRVKLTTLADFLMGFHDHSKETFFENIYQIEPGCYIHFNLMDGSKKHFRYYDLDKATEGKTSTIEELSDCIKETIYAHLRSDVPIGTCLSGGLDSSTIATIAGQYMNNYYSRQLHAITAQSEDPVNDESTYAREVVDNSNLIWYLTKPSADNFLMNWGNCLWHQDEPVGGPSILMQYYVMKTAHQKGLKVMLDGQGGDEALLGYERYYGTFLLEIIKRGEMFNFGIQFIKAIEKSKLNALQMFQYLIYFTAKWLRVLVNKSKWNLIPPTLLDHGLNTLRESCNTYKSIRSLQIAEITKYQLPHLLRYEDRNSMAWSIEARVPFVDHKIIEMAVSLQPNDKIQNGYTKYALRKIMDKKMPDNITWRRNKIGFEVSPPVKTIFKKK